MTKILLIFVTVFIAQVFGSIVDIFDQTAEHEPRVAIYCGHVPFHIDLKTGKWISDRTAIVKCDANKEDVKRYCQKIYPKLNISNIVEANEKVVIQNWCKTDSKECNIEKKVVPYRCLVDDYEADALMVPKGCKFNHLHDEASCMSHDEWKDRAKAFCRKDDMKLNEYGILLSCGTDMFTGVEFVCCPRHHKHHKGKQVEKKKKPKVDRIGLERAVKELQKFLPGLTQGCDRTMYEQKRQKLEENHQSKIAAVVDEWDEAEARYKKLKTTNLAKAQEKMKKTLKVFRETLATLEEEAKEERIRLKTEHANCIQININKQKREAMLAYMLAVQEKPHSMKRIIRSARKFFQVCEHDRLHSLRHFQHVRKQQPEVAEKLRKTLLEHLQQLNDVVNKSLSLLSHLPDIAEKFGLTGMLQHSPTVVPEIIATEPPTEKPAKQEQKNIPERILKMIKKMKSDEKKYKELQKLKKVEKPEPVSGMLLPEDIWPVEMKSDKPADKEEPVGFPFYKEVETTSPPTEMPATEPVETTMSVVTEEKEPVEIEPVEIKKKAEEDEDNETFLPDKGREMEEQNSSKKKLSQGTLNPTDAPPKTTYDSEGLPEDEHPKTQPGKHGKSHVKHRFFKQPRSPAAFAAVIGLSCGALVIMLGIIVALVMRRNRGSQAHVYIPDSEPEDQEHLVKMQKSGYENPTYKFFYY